MDRSQVEHEKAARSLLNATPPLLLSPFVAAEVDYMVGKYVDETARWRFLQEIRRGAYDLVQFRSHDLQTATEVIAKYADLKLSLADASIVALAARYGANTVLTLDERDFRAVVPVDGASFRLLPADA